MRYIRKSGRSESGQALIIVTIILLLASLIIPSLLSLNFSGTRSAQISEERTLRLYAADAGIEDALYQLRNRLEGNGSEKSYTLAGALNRSTVAININNMGDGIYKILSTASDISGRETAVESYVSFDDYSFLTEYAVATNGEGEVKSGGVVQGDVRAGTLENKGTIIGNTTVGQPITNWPTVSEMISFYREDIVGLPPVSSLEINGNPDLIGPLYLFNGGATVNITSKQNKYARLEGTIYVEGKLVINLKASSRIELNGHTIFVEGDVVLQPNTSLAGPGCIIATGDIDFQPNMTNQEFILVMSITGEVEIKPGTDFYGTLTGAQEVEVYPGGGVINTAAPPGNLNFPGLDGNARQVDTIQTYAIVTGG